MRRSILLPVLILLTTALSGCGQKGPLILPTRPAAASTGTAPATPAVISDPAAANAGPR